MMSPERETTQSFINDLMRMLTSRGRAFLKLPRDTGGGTPPPNWSEVVNYTKGISKEINSLPGSSS
jgi:hypothetical protein